MYQFRGLPEVSLALRVDGEEAPIAAGGKVGWLVAGKSALLTIRMRSAQIWPIAVDGKKDIVLRRDKSDDPDVQIYPTSIAIKESQVSGVAHTEYPDNHVRVLRHTDGGNVEMWEIALVSQDGLFWITVQKTYDIACGRDASGQFFCPTFAEKWPQLVELLAKLLTDIDLPVGVAPQPGIRPLISGLKSNEGIVLWYNLAQQMGAIATNQGQARVHWSQIIAIEGELRRLTAGAKVRFRDLLRPKQLKFGRKTSFRWEAVDVRPV